MGDFVVMLLFENKREGMRGMWYSKMEIGRAFEECDHSENKQIEQLKN